MQAASSNFARAITGSSGVWAPPLVLADWVGDGFDQLKTPDIRDYFSRSCSNGWGRADSGHLWTPLNSPASDYYTSGDGTATISMSTVDQRAIAVGGLVSDFDVKFRVSTNQLATGQAQRASVIGRVQDNATFYQLRCDFNKDQVIGYGMMRYIGGTAVVFSSGLVPGILHAVGRKFWVRGQGIGNTFRIKIWQDGTDEPAAWTATAADGGLTAPGQVGFRASVATGNTNTAPLVYTVDSFTNGAWDDLTRQAGTISAHQALDDGLPSDITYTSGSDSTSSASVSVGDRAGLSAAQYWSQDTAVSPIAGYDRDVPALTVAAGPVTAGGIERVTVFTGQMSDAPVQGFTAAIDAVSKSRLALTSLVEPPPIWGDLKGLTGTWPVSWALAMCSLYTSPPPRPGCLWWSPMHGSLQPFMPTSQPNSELDTSSSINIGDSFHTQPRPTFVPGPYLEAAFAQCTTGRVISNQQSQLQFNYGTSLFSKAGSAGRLEFWVRTDAVNVSSPPGGGGSVPYLVGFEFLEFVTVTTKITAGLGKDFKPFITVNDGSNTRTFTAGTAVPQDGGWHFIGVAWDMANNKLWLKSDSNAAQTNNPSPAMTIANLPSTDTVASFGSTYPQMTYFLPAAEVQITSGAQANPDNYIWINDPSYFTLGAVARPSILDLVALAETQPVEAAELIANYAQAELAMTRTDEQDRFCYLPMTYWAETTQQTVTETVSTAANVGTDWNITRDLTKIRNQVTVNYTAAQISNTLAGAPADIAISFTVYTLRPGITTLTIPFVYPTVALLGTTFHLVTATDVANGAASSGPNFICANTAADGSGTFATASQVTANITAWNAGQATVTVVNSTTTTYYTANTGVVPYVDIRGTYLLVADASVTAQDSVNIAKRGTRGMSVSLPTIQDADTATFIANELLTRAKSARRQLAITVRGDPRRQPGDLVKFTDPNNTNTTGVWRVLTVDHNIDGATYTQALAAVEGSLIATWDQSEWDDGSIWGP